jgi:hypothetical protein
MKQSFYWCAVGSTMVNSTGACRECSNIWQSSSSFSRRRCIYVLLHAMSRESTQMYDDMVYTNADRLDARGCPVLKEPTS